VVPVDGVITSWRVEVEPGQPQLAQRLEVFQVVSEAEEYRKLAESTFVNVSEGVNSFPARIPVREGNSIGLHGEVETLFCDKEEGAISALHDGAVALGETRVFKASAATGTPLTVRVEPDGDADGYGDETQDRCPRGAAYQGECPTVTLRTGAVVKRRAILLTVRASGEASVRVYGQVGWGLKVRPHQQGGTAKESATQKTRLIVGLRGGTKEVVGGRATRFRIPLPKPALRRLGRLTPKESLKARITAGSTDLAGRVRNARLTVKLPGRRRPG
jgi:hypothetical protein